MEFVIITGMSGAGKSNVVNAMEDLGFFCVDNLPVQLLETFALLAMNSKEHSRFAVVIDIRAGSGFSQLISSIEKLRSMQMKYKLIFIDSTDETLVKRYKETRRKHPLEQEHTDLVSNLVLSERQKLLPLKNIADYLIETSAMSVNDCKSRVRTLFSKKGNKQMNIHFISFGFKHGLMSEADYVFDVRFLPNPYYIAELKASTGLDQHLKDYIFSFEQSVEFKDKLTSLLDFVIPSCIKEGRSQLVIAIGCTGGHHRSVCFVSEMHDYFADKGYSVSMSHRDILK